MIARGCRQRVGTAALLLAILFALFSPVQPSEAAGVVATGARVGGDEVRTRFVADLSKAVSYTVYVLPDPYRVVIDLPGVRFDMPPGTGNQSLGLIGEYRFGEVESGKSRIVIDTRGPVLIEKSFVVEAQAGQPARIVVDLIQTTEQAFLKTYEAEAPRSQRAIAGAAGLSAPKPKAAQAADPARKLATLRRKPRKTIVIDPGHGGIDPGAIGLKKTREKDVVLAFSLNLRDILVKDGRYDVVMTRSGDDFVSLRDRIRIARDHEADLFIAVHADTVRGRDARGATIYTLSEKASDAEAEALAHKENRADIIGGLDLGTENEQVTGILINLVQRESKNHSIFFARKAVAEMRSITRFTGKPLRSAGFVVLKAPDVPSVLVELGYLSSQQDESQLTSASWRNQVAGAMAKAIGKYFATEVAQRGN